MTIDRLHHEIKLRWNKINSNHKKGFPSAYLDDAINKAQDDFIEIFYSGNNSKQYRFGFEVTQQRIDMLSDLVVINKSITPVLITTNRYSLTINNLNPAYKHFVSGAVIQDNCISPITIVRYNDLNEKLLNENTKPSKKWKRVLGTFSDGKIILYSDGVITSASIDYIKVPNKVFIGGYDSLEYVNGDSSAYSSVSPKVTSQINGQYHDLLIDMTVQYLASILEDVNKLQLQEKIILNKT